ncbi:hypothetical protein [Autumnicola psychrophila]|uniref:Uncharacterized protein n=1 Tax=Autumnicola psychrophila TaxID=3075592 RepID=A0ABU3DR39_9FLAO|nr:hypothetical protein [Zunongwangia sp. F225]MDT0686182.1 hypothetical protein [Zunongwangia sp. F225]
MKKYLLIMAAVVSTSFFTGCETDDEFTAPNYAALEMSPVDIKVELGGSTSYDVNVYTADVVGNDRTFDVVVRNSSTMSSAAYAVPATVTVPGGTNEGTFTVNVDDVDFRPNGESLILGIAREDGGFVGDDFQLNVSWSCDNPLVIDFVFDDYASEATWDVTDAEGDILLSGGGFADGAASATVERCLSDGDYTFTVYDSYGDGLSADGSVTLSFSGEDLVVIPGAFTTEMSVDFTLGENASAGEPYVNVDEDDSEEDSEGEGDDTDGSDSDEGDDSDDSDSDEGDDSDDSDSDEGDDSEGDETAE